MSIGFMHQREAAPARQRPGPETTYRRASQLTSRSCCCPSHPAVIVLMPPTKDRPHTTDLLLCGHHYRVSRQALDAADAKVTDLDGRPVTDDWPELPGVSHAPEALSGCGR